MANIKVRDLSDTTTITKDNQIMVLTNDPSNIVQNITVENFNKGITSSDANNGIIQGTDGKLYVNNADSGVTAGTYQFPQNLVVDEKGKITSVVSGSPVAVPIATSSDVGIVKPDNTTIAVDNVGVISCTIDVTTKANTNLDNLTSTSSPNFDGQWVVNVTVISSATAVGTYQIDLGPNGFNLLPNDGYDYECICGYIITRHDASNANTTYNVISDSTYYLIDSIDGGTSSGDYVANGGQFTMIANASSTVEVKIESTALYASSLVFRASRRIGTNS